VPVNMRKIDPSLNLGLHELANSGSYSFQLAFAKEQAEDILTNLKRLVDNTLEKAPMRTKKFCLDRVTAPKITHEEDKWERAIYKRWAPKSAEEYVPVCKHIQTYQYPLQASYRDKCWGKIDLLGIGADFLPVPNELKKRRTNESPLRMLVEVAAYGFAILKVWPNLKVEWANAILRNGESPSHFPSTLERLCLIGVAPREYWCRCLGSVANTKEGKFPIHAWPNFWKLVDALDKWFDIHFVSIEGSWDEMKGLPTITGARLLDLRSLSSNRALDMRK
jgi:hypothetical protein